MGLTDDKYFLIIETFSSVFLHLLLGGFIIPVLAKYINENNSLVLHNVGS